jgi:putative two-component system response regulator
MQRMIFVVDDSYTNLAKAESALEEQYQVITMLSGTRLFEMLKKVTPDLILLDIEMPEMDGLEILKRLKNHTLYSTIPVIMVTTEGTTYNVATTAGVGACDFVVKPFKKDILLDKVAKHIRKD